MAADRSLDNLSPLRSLSSFKSEIPLTMMLGDTLPTTKKNGKSFHQHLELVINSIPLHVVVLTLAVVNCLIVMAELLFAYQTMKDVPKDTCESVLLALSATSLSFLSLFVLEVVVRIFSMGITFIRRKTEICDACIVLVAFLVDLVFFVSMVQEDHQFVRAFSLIIILRLWRLWGILQGEKKRVREETACELEMEKYARRQAEAQTDALQAQCDQQLIEIAYLRDFLHQNNLDPDTKKHDFLPSYRTSVSISTGAVEYEKADTVRASGRLSKELSLDSLASSTKEPSSPVLTPRNIYSEAPSVPSASPPPTRTTASSSSANAASTSSTQQHHHPSSQGERPVEKGRSYVGDEARTAVDAENGEGNTNLAFEGDSQDRPSNSSGSRTDSDGDEAQLRIELDEIRRLSEEALQSELANSLTKEVDGIPTTSL